MNTLHTLKEGCLTTHIGFNGGRYFVHSWFDESKTFDTLKELFKYIRTNSGSNSDVMKSNVPAIIKGVNYVSELTAIAAKQGIETKEEYEAWILGYTTGFEARQRQLEN